MKVPYWGYFDRSSVTKLTLSALVMAQFGGCNDSKTENQFQNATRSTNPLLDENAREIIRNQNLYCSSKEDCHPSLVKILLLKNGKPRFCTGFLVGPEHVATSSGCLDDSLRVTGASCNDRVFFYLTKDVFTDLNKKGPIHCDTVTHASSSPEKDLIVRGGDIAFLKMSEKVDREPLAISSEGISDGEVLRVWKVDKSNDRDAVIKKNSCMASHNSFANPLAVSKFSPVIPIMGCEYIDGNEGSPVLNEKGEVVGVMNTPLEQEISNYLKNSNLTHEQEMASVFVSNIACAPKVGAMSFTCDRYPTNNDLRNARDEMLNDPSIHWANFKAADQLIKEQVSLFKSRFLHWKAELVKKAPGVNEIIATPDCFYRFQDWIESMKVPVVFWQYKKTHTYTQSFPEIKIETKFDKYLKPVSKVLNERVLNYKIRFSPRDLVDKGTSYVETVVEGKKSLFKRVKKAYQDSCY
jgi:hypothetical protein